MTAATDTTTEPATECAGIKLRSLLKSVVFIFLFPVPAIPNRIIKKNSRRLITGERSNCLIPSSAQQQQSAVPQPIITTAAIIIMLLMLLKTVFIFSSSYLKTLSNIPHFFHCQVPKNKKSKNFSPP